MPNKDKPTVSANVINSVPETPPIQKSPSFTIVNHQKQQPKNRHDRPQQLQTNFQPKNGGAQGGGGRQRQHRTDANRTTDLCVALRKVLTHKGENRSVGIFESHYHGVNGDDIAPDMDKVSIGGLCIPATADAIETCPNIYSNYRSVVVDVWSNGYFHHGNEIHLLEDGVRRFLKAAKRVFPNAKLIIITPFSSEKLRRCRGSAEAVARMVEHASAETSIPVTICGNIDTRGLRQQDWHDFVHIKRHIVKPLLVNVVRSALSLPMRHKVQSLSINALRGQNFHYQRQGNGPGRKF